MGADSGEARNSDPGARFQALLQRLGAESRFGGVYPELEAHYSQSGRHYHTIGHVIHCLEVMDEVRDRLRDPDAVELALWFHDVIYDPRTRDNELRSALMFDRLLGVHLPTTRADNVHAMIMATVHPNGTEDQDEQFVSDIDLSGLGLPWPEFISDTEDLRRERRHLTDAEFEHGTLSFFNKLLDRRNIYLTGLLREKYESRARDNICKLTRRFGNKE